MVNAIRRQADQAGHDTSWPTTGRPTNPNHGTTGYNETLQSLESWDATAQSWVAAGSLTGLTATAAQLNALVAPGTVAPVTAGAVSPFNDAVLSYGINQVTSSGTTKGVQLPTPFVNAVCVVYDLAGAGFHVSTANAGIDISYDNVLDIAIPAASNYGNTFMFMGLSATRWLLVTGALG
jgi:hypothetical protein